MTPISWKQTLEFMDRFARENEEAILQARLKESENDETAQLNDALSEVEKLTRENKAIKEFIEVIRVDQNEMTPKSSEETLRLVIADMCENEEEVKKLLKEYDTSDSHHTCSIVELVENIIKDRNHLKDEIADMHRADNLSNRNE